MSAITTAQNVLSALGALDSMRREPSRFEANILDTMLRQMQAGRLPSPKQHRILCEMVEKYLQDPALLRALQDETATITREEPRHASLQL